MKMNCVLYHVTKTGLSPERELLSGLTSAAHSARFSLPMLNLLLSLDTSSATAW